MKKFKYNLRECIFAFVSICIVIISFLELNRCMHLEEAPFGYILILFIHVLLFSASTVIHFLRSL